MKQQPLISIIIPTYNRAGIIKKTLDSFIHQTYTNWECIVVDDGSTDETLTLLKKLQNKDARFRFYSRPDSKPKGANACRNYGFEQSKGDFVNWFDSDDLATPKFLETRINILLENPTLDMAACYAAYFYEDKRPNKLQERNENNFTDCAIENYILHGLSFYTPAPLWRKQYLISQNEFFDETLQRSQERDLHFRLICKGLSYTRYSNKPLFLIRSDHESITSQSSTSLTAKKSVFKVRQKIFNLTLKSNVKEKQKLIEYLFYRQASLVYNMGSSLNNKKERTALLNTCFLQLQEIQKASQTLKKHSVRLKKGQWLLKNLQRGYKFFYFPQYDHRSY